jgi:RNA polymerase sigma-70 factor (ECF subfamily)
MTYEPVSLESLLSHQNWALRLARRLVREENEAEDLLQRTWIAALRHPPGSARGARSWIRKVILNLARERYRRDQTRSRHERAGARREDSADAFELTSQREISGLLGKELMRLEEPYRAVLVQRYYEGLSSAEIARRMGVPAGTVRWRLKVGLDQLREELDRRADGDRTRWVSALLVLLPPASPATTDAEDSSPPGASKAALSGASVPLLAWAGLAASVLVGGYFVLRGGVTRGESGATLVANAPLERAPERSSATPELTREPLAGSATAPEPDPAALRGLSLRVVDAAGVAQPGARLEVALASGFEPLAETDASGRARWLVRPEQIDALDLPISRGRVAVRARAPGRAASKLVFVAPPFDGEREVALVVGGPELVLRGQVLDEEGNALGGAEVAWLEEAAPDALRSADFERPWSFSTRADGEGRFVLLNLPERAGILLGRASGHALTTGDLATLGAPGELELRLARGARVSGRLVLPAGGPATDIEVYLEPRTQCGEGATGLAGYDPSRRGFVERARTDAAGRFELAAVAAGKRRIWAVDAERGWLATAELELADGGEERFDAGLAPRAALELVLVDARGAPLADWIAHVRRPDGGSWWIRRRAADADGRVRIPDCLDEALFVDVFEPSGSGSSFGSWQLRPLEGEQRLEIDPRGPGTVWGRVRDSEGGPAQSAELTFFALRTSLTTTAVRAADGAFETSLAPGSYLVVAREDEAACVLARVQLKSGERRELGELALPPLGTLRLDGSGLVRGADQPTYAVHALCTVTREERHVLVARGALEGERLLQLFAGRHRVRCDDGNGATREYDVTVAPYGETRLALVP